MTILVILMLGVQTALSLLMLLLFGRGLWIANGKREEKRPEDGVLRTFLRHPDLRGTRWQLLGLIVFLALYSGLIFAMLRFLPKLWPF